MTLKVELDHFRKPPEIDRQAKMQPETRYAQSGDLRIAYQILQIEPIDVVFVLRFFSNRDHYWDEPTIRQNLLTLREI